MFSRRVIARCGPPAGVPYNASASFRGKIVRSVRYSFELGTRTRAETSPVPSHTVRTCIHPTLHC